MLRLPVINSQFETPAQLGSDFHKWSKANGTAGLLKPDAQLKQDNNYKQNSLLYPDPRGASYAYLDKHMPMADRFREFYDDDDLATQFPIDTLTLAQMKKQEPLSQDMLLDPYSRRTENYEKMTLADIKNWQTELNRYQIPSEFTVGRKPMYDQPSKP